MACPLMDLNDVLTRQEIEHRQVELLLERGPIVVTLGIQGYR